MTWFETEQISKYVAELWAGLEEWSLNRVQMRDALAELDRLYRKLKVDMEHHAESSKNTILEQLLGQMQQCRLSLTERLKH